MDTQSLGKIGAAVKVLPIDAIKIGDRCRKELGDINALVASIADTGLLQFPVVNSDNDLIAGFRRMRAMEQLGHTEIPCHVAENLADVSAMLKAERDENICRLDFTPTEAVRMGEAIESVEREAAKQRQSQGPGRKASGNLPEGKGDTRDKVGAALGMSGRTYEKAKEVAEAAQQEPEKYGALAEEMDRTRRVNGVHRKLKVAKQCEAIAKEPPVLSGGPFRVIVVDPP